MVLCLVMSFEDLVVEIEGRFLVSLVEDERVGEGENVGGKGC